MSSVQKDSGPDYSTFRLHKIFKNEFLRLFRENVQMNYVHETNAIRVKSRQVQVKLEKLRVCFSEAEHTAAPINTCTSKSAKLRFFF